jgi:hypothetical protein
MKHIKKQIATLGLVAIASAGCMSSGTTKISALTIEHQGRQSLATPKENIDSVAGQIYKQSQIYQRNDLNQETINTILGNSAFFKAYENERRN